VVVHDCSGPHDEPPGGPGASASGYSGTAIGASVKRSPPCLASAQPAISTFAAFGIHAFAVRLRARPRARRANAGRNPPPFWHAQYKGLNNAVPDSKTAGNLGFTGTTCIARTIAVVFPGSASGIGVGDAGRAMFCNDPSAACWLRDALQAPLKRDAVDDVMSSRRSCARLSEIEFFGGSVIWMYDQTKYGDTKP